MPQQLMLTGHVTKLCVLVLCVRSVAGEEIVGNIETGRYQEGGGSGDRGRLGLTLIPRSVGSS